MLVLGEGKDIPPQEDDRKSADSDGEMAVYCSQDIFISPQKGEEKKVEEESDCINSENMDLFADSDSDSKRLKSNNSDMKCSILKYKNKNFVTKTAEYKHQQLVVGEREVVERSREKKNATVLDKGQVIVFERQVRITSEKPSQSPRENICRQAILDERNANSLQDQNTERSHTVTDTETTLEDILSMDKNISYSENQSSCIPLENKLDYLTEEFKERVRVKSGSRKRRSSGFGSQRRSPRIAEQSSQERSRVKHRHASSSEVGAVVSSLFQCLVDEVARKEGQVEDFALPEHYHSSSSSGQSGQNDAGNEDPLSPQNNYGDSNEKITNLGAICVDVQNKASKMSEYSLDSIVQTSAKVSETDNLESSIISGAIATFTTVPRNSPNIHKDHKLINHFTAAYNDNHSLINANLESKGSLTKNTLCMEKTCGILSENDVGATKSELVTEKFHNEETFPITASPGTEDGSESKSDTKVSSSNPSDKAFKNQHGPACASQTLQEIGKIQVGNVIKCIIVWGCILWHSVTAVFVGYN